MMDPSFKPALEKVRKETKHAIRVPNPGITWSADEQGSRVVALRVEVDQAVLDRNMQTNSASWVSFLLGLAYFLELAQKGGPVRCEGHILGNLKPRTRGHRWRSLFLLSEMARLLPERLTITPALPDVWQGIANPMINSPRTGSICEKEGTRWQDLLNKKGELTERALECQIFEHPEPLLQALKGEDPPIKMRSQFPVGLFEKEVSKATHLTPGGTSEVDLWGQSRSKKILHLFELKKPGNQMVGILTEAFYYTMLLKAVKTRNIECNKPDWPGYQALKKADRIVMWLTAEGFHPLIANKKRTPLALFNQALKPEGVEFRLLRYQLKGNRIMGWEILP